MYGLIKNHLWVGGNRRTATALTQIFLRRNGAKITATVDDIVQLAPAVESGERQPSEIVNWLRAQVTSL